MKMPSTTPFSCKITALLIALGSLVGAAQAQTLYVSVNSGGTIQRVTSGSVGGTTLATGLTHPTGLAFGPNGNLYVSQDLSGTATSLVSQVAISGGAVTTFISGLQLPLGLAFSTSGDLYIANYTSPMTISKVTSGTSTAVTFATGLNSPFGLALNAAGTLFVANRDNGTISQITNMSTGTFAQFASGLGSPNDLVFDGSGNLFVSDFGTGALNSGSIFKVTPGGVVSPFVSNLTSPVGLAFDPITGALFVAQQGFSNILEVTNLGGATGSVSTFATGISGVQYLAVESSAVPEPSTYAVFAGLGALGFAAWRRRRAVSTPAAA